MSKLNLTTKITKLPPFKKPGGNKFGILVIRILEICPWNLSLCYLGFNRLYKINPVRVNFINLDILNFQHYQFL